MGTLSEHGVTVDVPSGWDGRIFAHEPTTTGSDPHRSGARTAEAAPDTPPAIVQLATFALPRPVGDFGGGAVDLMQSRDLFVTLFEYGAESASTALFARAESALPRLTQDDFDPNTLRKLLDGQSGTQRFFTVKGRPFCLYVVLGSHLRRFRTVPVLNDLLGRVMID